MRRFWLGVGVVMLLAAAGFGVWWLSGDGRGSRTGPNGSPAPGLPTAEEIAGDARSSLQADDDSDGLINADELTWGTDPLVSDTDGDGYLDGEEVTARHDPRKPAPNDKLDAPTSQVPAPQLTVLLEAPSFDQYLQSDVSLTVSDTNLTREYEEAVPAASRSPAALADFAQTQPITTLLPTPDSSDMPSGQPTTVALLGQYLRAADHPGVLANTEAYLLSQHALREEGDASGIERMATLFREYRAELQKTAVPEAGLPLHRLLLAYADAQAVSFDQIAVYADDPATSLVATRQAEALDRTYYPLIRAELERLGALREELLTGSG